MNENGPTFEQMDIEAARGVRPQENLDDQQFTQAETSNIDAATSAEPKVTGPEPTDPEYQETKKFVLQRVTELIQRQGDKTRMRRVVDHLDYSKITAESHPHLMREVRVILRTHLDAWWSDIKNDNLSLIADRHSQSLALLTYIQQDISFLYRNGIDVSQFVRDTDEAVQKNLKGDFNRSSQLHTAGHQLEQLRRMITTKAA